MKAVDPSIKVGTMDWLEDVLRHCGELVDFVSIHTYPVGISPVPGAMTDDELFAKLDQVSEDMEKTHALIRRYQPRRENEIEISYSEWNMGWSDVRGALWHAAWVGEMFRHGAHFAMQWDLFNIVGQTESENVRRSIYWAFWLWSQAMGNSLVSFDLKGPDHVAAYATKSEGGLQIMAINQSAEDELTLDTNLEGITPAALAQQVRFTHREYFWLDREPDKPQEVPSAVWNTGPTIRSFQAGRSFRTVVPPLSIVVLAIPTEGRRPFLKETKAPEAKEPRLRLWFPPEIYAGDRVQAWAYVQNGEDRAPYPLPLADGEIHVEGAASADRKLVRLSEAAGRFFIRSDEAGTAMVQVRSGKWRGAQEVVFKPSVPRRHIFWDFEEDTIPDFMRSQWRLTFDNSVRANEKVARISFGGEVPKGDEKRELLVIGELPRADKLRKQNIRGAVFDVRLSRDFDCDDSEAYIEVTMQSPANWWMPLGKVRLSDLSDREWKTKTLLTDDPKHTSAMHEAFNIWFIIQAKKPVHGSVFLDRAGLMVR
jgi:hypothetical protein